MAYSTINKSSLHFSPTLYVGNGGTQTITGIPFAPDWTWIKNRSSAEHHVLTDAVRGVDKQLNTNRNNAELSLTTQLTAFTSDGFSVGAGAEVNGNGNNMVSWNWKANGAGSANSDGSVSSTVSVNTTSGFSIVKFTASGSGGTVGHGLGVAPKVIIFKRLDAASDWAVYNESIGNVNMVFLNTTTAAGSNASILNSTSPTSSVFTVGSSNIVTGGPVIAYCFAEKTGFSKFDSYNGNGNADGAFIYTGFKPSFLIVKRSSDSTENWMMLDNKRSPFNVANKRLSPNLNAAENTDIPTDFLSNGFKIRTSGGGMNASGVTYIYMAFAEAPLVGSNNVPATAR